MNTELVNSVAARWASLGAMLNVRAEPVSDVEKLLLDTARAASANSRLFILAATWLARYGEYVAKHRLAKLIRGELEAEYRPTLGLLLEWADVHAGKSKRSRFRIAITACGKATDERPLTDIERRNPVFSRLAKERASTLSVKWGRWISEFKAKNEALRGAEWIVERNPTLADRALAGGDVASSVLAECEAEPGMIPSESELALRCGASRPAVRDALLRLRLANRIVLHPHKKKNLIQLRTRQVVQGV